MRRAGATRAVKSRHECLPDCGRFFCGKEAASLKIKAELMDEAAMRRALTRIAHEILEKNRGAEGLFLVGIKRRGAPLAEMIRADIQRIEGVLLPCGSVDIKYYRDDLLPIGDAPLLRRSELPGDVTGRTVVLVDDVLYTGRTARSGMDAVIACGRPKAIRLAVLIDRGHRELPIRADFVGKNVPTAHTERVEVRVPPYEDDMRVCLIDVNPEK